MYLTTCTYCIMAAELYREDSRVYNIGVWKLLLNLTYRHGIIYIPRHLPSIRGNPSRQAHLNDFAPFRYVSLCLVCHGWEEIISLFAMIWCVRRMTVRLSGWCNTKWCISFISRSTQPLGLQPSGWVYLELCPRVWSTPAPNLGL